jgi:hypothetical protein
LQKKILRKEDLHACVLSNSVRTVEVKQEVTDEFNMYADEIMKTMVWTGGCRSWYKGGRVNGRVSVAYCMFTTLTFFRLPLFGLAVQFYSST